MKRIWISVILLLVGLQLASAKVLDSSHFFDTSLGDFQEELELAKEEGKLGIFIFFQLDECPFCHWMKQNVLNQQDVQSYYRKLFRNFSVDIEGDIEIVDFQGNETTEKQWASKKYRVRATPVLAFFDLSGKLIMRYTGRTRDKREFLLLADYIKTKAYKKMRFSKYKRQKHD